MKHRWLLCFAVIGVTAAALIVLWRLRVEFEFDAVTRHLRFEPHERFDAGAAFGEGTLESVVLRGARELTLDGASLPVPEGSRVLVTGEGEIRVDSLLAGADTVVTLDADEDDKAVRVALNPENGARLHLSRPITIECDLCEWKSKRVEMEEKRDPIIRLHVNPQQKDSSRRLDLIARLSKVRASEAQSFALKNLSEIKLYRMDPREQLKPVSTLTQDATLKVSWPPSTSPVGSDHLVDLGSLQSSFLNVRFIPYKSAYEVKVTGKSSSIRFGPGHERMQAIGVADTVLYLGWAAATFAGTLLVNTVGPALKPMLRLLRQPRMVRLPRRRIVGS